MNYLKSRFSVGMGGAEFGTNWEKTFGGKAQAEREIQATPSAIVKAVRAYAETLEAGETKEKLEEILAGNL